MATIKVTLRNIETGETKEVTGWPIEIPALPEYKFAVHHPWGKSTGWKVSELSTGMVAGSRDAMTTKKYAIEATLDRFTGITEETRQRLIAQIQKVQGMISLPEPAAPSI